MRGEDTTRFRHITRAKKVELIQVEISIGAGTNEDPGRTLSLFYDEKGNLEGVSEPVDRETWDWLNCGQFPRHG